MELCSKKADLPTGRKKNPGGFGQFRELIPKEQGRETMKRLTLATDSERKGESPNKNNGIKKMT